MEGGKEEVWVEGGGEGWELERRRKNMKMNWGGRGVEEGRWEHWEVRGGGGRVVQRRR